jgi:hypothetical protein
MLARSQLATLTLWLFLCETLCSLCLSQKLEPQRTQGFAGEQPQRDFEWSASSCSSAPIQPSHQACELEKRRATE